MPRKDTKGKKVLFSGLYQGQPMPSWWDCTAPTDDDTKQETFNKQQSFSEVIRQLPRAEKTDILYKNKNTDEWEDPEHYSGIMRQDTGELWHVPTKDYDILNPISFLKPLEKHIEESDKQQDVFGEFNLYRNGGEVHGTILFQDIGFEGLVDGDEEYLCMGFKVGWDFFGGLSHYIEPIGMRTSCTNSMEQLTDRKKLKHIGDVTDRESLKEVFKSIIDKTETMADELKKQIKLVSEITIDFTELDFGLEEFLQYLDLPQYLIDRAEMDIKSEAGTRQVTIWDIYNGLTYAISHYFKGKDGDRLKVLYRTAKDLIYNPNQVIDEVMERHEEMQKQGEIAATKQGTANLLEIKDNLEQKKEKFLDARERMETLVEEV